MAKTRKTAKPKQPSYERIDRKADSLGVYHDLEEFGDVVTAHGCYTQDIAQFCVLAIKSKRPPELPGAEGEDPATVPFEQKARPMPAAAKKTKEAAAEAGA